MFNANKCAGRVQGSGLIGAFSTRRAEIEVTVTDLGTEGTAGCHQMAQRVASVTRAARREGVWVQPRESWEKQALALGCNTKEGAADAVFWVAGRSLGGSTERGSNESTSLDRVRSTGRSANRTEGRRGVLFAI